MAKNISPLRLRLPVLALVAVLAATVPLLALTVSIGDTVNDFTAPDQNNQPFTLSDHRGQVVLLHICTVWCQPCRASATAEADLVAAIDTEIGSGNWVLVDALLEDNSGGPSSQPDANFWRDAFGTPATTLHTNGLADSAILDLVIEVGVGAFPSYIVIAPDGTVSFTQEGWDDNAPLLDAVVAAWYAYETPETQLLDLVAELESDGGVGRALAAKLNAAYGLITDGDPGNDAAVLNILRAVTNQAEAQSGKKLSEDQAAHVIGIVLELIDALGAG